MGAGRALRDVDARVCRTARAQLARSVQWSAPCHQDRRTLVLNAKRSAALDGGLSTGTALVGSGLLGCAGRGAPDRAETGCRTKGAAQCCHSGRSNIARLAESGGRVGYDGAKPKKGSKLHLAVDTLGKLLALHGTPASADDRQKLATWPGRYGLPPVRASN